MKRLAVVVAGVGLLALNLPAAKAVTFPTCFGESATIRGTTGSDIIEGTPRADVIVGLDGHDVIHGNGGADLICGADGSDTLHGDAGSDKLSGDNDQDTLFGGPGSDVLIGGGQHYPDVPGGDTVSYARSSAGVDLDLVTGTGGPVGQPQDRISAVSTIIGSPYDDTLIAAPGHGNKILAGAGNDTIVGNDGLDQGDELQGGTGNDHINGKDGPDTVAGGRGNDVLNGGGDTSGRGDTVIYEDAAGPVQIDLTSGLASGEGVDTLSGFTNVIGSFLNDVITGDSGPNAIQGEDGGDTIYGENGPDSLVGNGYACGGTLTTPGCSDGNDVIYGQGGNDTIYDNTNYSFGCGGPCPVYDTDVLVGGPGSDSITAGFGNDTLNVQDLVSGNDRADGGNGIDTCTFDPGDTIADCP